MFLIAIAFLAGHCAVHAMPELPVLLPWIPIPLAGALLLILAHWCARFSFKYLWCAALLLGGAWAWINATWQLADRLPPNTPALDTQVRGRIASMVDIDAEGDRFALDVVDADDKARARLPSHIELHWYDTQVHPLPGELWEFCVRLKSPRGFANPGGADYAVQQFRNGIGATGYVRGGARESACNKKIEAASSLYFILRARAAIADRLAAAIPNSPMLGIVQGLAVGDTRRISSAQWRVFANTGITHLIAISGSHIGMVAALIAWLSGRVARLFPLQSRRIAVTDVQSVCGMFAALAYSALAGFSVPTQRTLVMLLVYFGTRLLRRHIGITHGLSIALMAVLLIDPFAPLSPGFWLSFGAVAAIFLATSGQLKRPMWVYEYLHLQAVVTIGLLPFLIGAFGSVSLISPLVNLFAIPFYTFVLVPVVLFGALLLTVNMWFGTWVIKVAAFTLEKTWPLFEWASALPLASWHLPQLPLWIAVLLLLGCLLAIAPGNIATRMAGIVLCLPALTWHSPRPLSGEFELAVLDVGQGLAVTVITATHVLVYDTGPSFRSGRDTGQLVVVPYLQARGVHRIDTLMLSHGDNDHVGGAQSVLASVPTEQVLAGPSVTLPQPSELCQRGGTWIWDAVTFKILHPDVGESVRKNNSSCVLHIQGAGGSALLLGDVEREAEAQLADRKSLTPTDIVVVPHHGSRTSSTDSLTRATSPVFAVVSAGFGNQWGFPKPEVVARWQGVGAHALNTADSGAIEFAITHQGVQPQHEFRKEHRAYWRAD